MEKAVHGTRSPGGHHDGDRECSEPTTGATNRGPKDLGWEELAELDTVADGEAWRRLLVDETGKRRVKERNSRDEADLGSIEDTSQ